MRRGPFGFVVALFVAGVALIVLSSVGATEEVEPTVLVWECELRAGVGDVRADVDVDQIERSWGGVVAVGPEGVHFGDVRYFVGAPEACQAMVAQAIADELKEE